MSNVYAPPGLLGNQIQQHGIHSNNQANSIIGTGGTDEGFGLLDFKGTTNVDTCAENTNIADSPISETIIDLLKQKGGVDALRAILDLPTPIQNQQECKADIIPTSVTSMDVNGSQGQNPNKKRRHLYNSGWREGL